MTTTSDGRKAPRQRLTPLDHHQIKMHILDGLSQAEIGRRMQLNRQTVNKAIQRLKRSGEWDQIRVRGHDGK